MSNIISIVLEAVQTNHLPRLQATLNAWQAQETPRNPRQPMIDFQPALEAALDNHNVEAAEELLRRGCEINPDAVIAAGDSFDEPNWDSRSFDVLLKHGYDINDDLGLVGNALSLAIIADKPPVVKYLLENGADPNDNYYMDKSPLHWARTKDPKIVELLLAQGAKDDQGATNGQGAEE